VCELVCDILKNIMMRLGAWQGKIIGLTAFLFLAAHAAFAQGLVTCGNSSGSICTWNDLIGTGGNSLVSRVVNYALFGFAVPIAVGFFIWGGIKMITSGGNEGRFKEGKDVVTGVLWGLAIALGAWIIINTVIAILTA
jgi:hypothetical protein